MKDQDRVYSVDFLRGLVIVLMVLGHSRHFFLHHDFAPTNLSLTFPSLFFTRWITNICSPVFVFLAGISIYLVQKKRGSLKELAATLIKRGLFLIILEATLLTFFWHTHFDVIQLQVIWIIGVSFLCMAALIYVPLLINLGISLIVVIFHHLLETVILPPDSSVGRILLMFLHRPGDIVLSEGFRINVLYSLFPYLGIMLLGYCTGILYSRDPILRRRLFVITGGGMILLFVLLRWYNLYGDPSEWQEQARGGIYTLMSFLNVTKYPPSFLFTLSTLGPALLLLAVFEKRTPDNVGILVKVGQVAMFFYLFHIPFIRVVSKLYFLVFNANPGIPAFFTIYIIMLIPLILASLKYREYKIRKRRDPGYQWLRYL